MHLNDSDDNGGCRPFIGCFIPIPLVLILTIVWGSQEGWTAMLRSPKFWLAAIIIGGSTFSAFVLAGQPALEHEQVRRNDSAVSGRSS